MNYMRFGVASRESKEQYSGITITGPLAREHPEGKLEGADGFNEWRCKKRFVLKDISPQENSKVRVEGFKSTAKCLRTT